MRACVASILEVPYKDVPFIDPDKEDVESFLAKWRAYTQLHGFDLLWVWHDVVKHRPLGLSIGVGENKDGEDHAVVCLDGEIVFDPYLGGATLKSIKTYGYFVAMNPKGTQP